MEKPDSLRKAIGKMVPSLARDPERLLMFVDRGKVSSRMTDDHSFAYSYILNIIITNFAGDKQPAVMVAILEWLRINQPDLLTPQKDAIEFDVDIIDNKLVDMSLEIALTEQAKVVRDEVGNGFEIEFLAEPDPLLDDAVDLTEPAAALTDHEVEDIIQ